MSESTTAPAVALSSIRSTADRNRLDRLCTEHRELANNIAADKLAQKELLKDIVKLAAKLKLKSNVEGDNWLLTPFTGRKLLKKELLLANGVGTEVIERCTVKGKGGWSVRGRNANGGDEESGDE
jgi:hypothetical protein